MGRVEILVSDPSRNSNVLLVKLSIERQFHRVLEPSTRPLEDHAVRVDSQSVLKTAPHPDSGMVPPTIFRFDQCSRNLKSFNSLLSQTTPIEHHGGTDEACIRKKRLHQTQTLVVFPTFDPDRRQADEMLESMDST